MLALHTELGDPPVRPFTTELVEGVVRHQAGLDQAIASVLPQGWTLGRMARVDRNLARLAVFEIDHTDLAPEIAVAEAVGLARDLSTDESPAFLNGLLGAIVRRRSAGTA